MNPAPRLLKQGRIHYLCRHNDLRDSKKPEIEAADSHIQRPPTTIHDYLKKYRLSADFLDSSYYGLDVRRTLRDHLAMSDHTVAVNNDYRSPTVAFVIAPQSIFLCNLTFGVEVRQQRKRNTAE